MKLKDRQYDRFARIGRVVALIQLHKTWGVTVERLAELCEVDKRTIYRDIKALESIWHAKFQCVDGRYSLIESDFLNPITLTRLEALTIFMASRLLLSHSKAFNPHVATTFEKLGATLDPQLRDEIRKTLEWMRRRKPDQKTERVLDEITHCWLNHKTVRMRYWTLNRHSARERLVDTYYIQPSALDHATYLIGYCHHRKQVLVFRVDRIHDAERTKQDYEIPADFDANVYLSPYWGMTATGTPQEVILRFRPEVARIAAETLWHESQATQLDSEGYAVVTMKLALTRDLVSFILGWGEMVEVLQPRALRRQIADAASRLYKCYESALEDGQTPLPCFDTTSGSQVNTPDQTATQPVLF